jgi:hypothetical protein
MQAAHDPGDVAGGSLGDEERNHGGENSGFKGSGFADAGRNAAKALLIEVFSL